MMLTELFQRNGPPDHSGSIDNGAEFTVHAVRYWLDQIAATTLYPEPTTSWEERLRRELDYMER